MKAIEIAPGTRFGKLVVIKRNGSNKQRQAVFLCKCDCGNIHEAIGNHLRSGRCDNCGCEKATKISARHYKGALDDPFLHKKWSEMKSRCNNPNNKSFKDYGARGIKVCPEWNDNYTAFKEWAVSNGYSKELQIDRINNDAGYSPQNCRFVSRIENCNNRRSSRYIEFCGEKITIAQLARKVGSSYSRLLYLINSGLNVEDAVKRSAL